MSSKINKLVLGSIVAAGLAFGSSLAGAYGFNRTMPADAGKVFTKDEFYQTLKETKPTQVAKVFGFPDEILTLKNPQGETRGVVWVYHKAVQNEGTMQDARFAVVEGKLEYVSLAKSS